MAYVAWSVVFGEQPSASKWNILGANDASFNDGTGIAAGVITNTQLAWAAPQGATVAANDVVVSATFAAFPTNPGPAVTIVTRTQAFVHITGTIAGGNAGNSGNLGFAVSGASTIAASDTYSVFYIPYTSAASDRRTGVFLVTGLTAGSNTFTAQGKNGGTNVNISDRRLSVMPV